MTLWCDRIIRGGFLLLFTLVPLLLTPWNYELFEFNKMVAVYVLTTIITGAWMVKMIAERKIKIRRTPLDIPILFFISAQFLSSLFSIDPHVSWFGYYSRFNGGMWSIITYVVLFYAFITNLTHWSHRINLIKVMLATAGVVSLYGLLERMGIDKHLWVQDVQNRVFSTLGQPNWLAAYLVALMPLGMAFGIKTIDDRRLKIVVDGRKLNIDNPKQSSIFYALPLSSIIYFLLSLLFFLVLLFTRSRSGLLGMAVADVIFWLLILSTKLSTKLSFKVPKSSALKAASSVPQSSALKAASSVPQSSALKRLAIPFIIYHLSFVICLFFFGTGIPRLDRYLTFNDMRQRFSKSYRQSTIDNRQSTTNFAPLLETGGTESGTIRKYVWQGAINAWLASPKNFLIGTGTETFAWAFFQYRPRGHNITSEWDFLYNKAHNEYLNYLATTGVFGLGSYLLFIGTFIVWFIKKVHGSWFMVHGNKKDVFTMNNELLTINLALFSGWVSILVTNFFGFSVVVTQVFLFLFSAIIVTFFQDSRNPNFFDSGNLRLPSWAIWVPTTIGLYMLIKISSFWFADASFAAGYRANRAEIFDKAAPLLSRAIRLNPGEPFYHDELSLSYAGLAASAAKSQNATEAARLAKQALTESDTALRTSPNNVNFWKTRTKIYYTLSALDQQLGEAAIEALMRARVLSPNDPKIVYNLAILYGRQGDNDRAIQLLNEAKTLKADYRDAYFGLYVFYTEMKQPEKAKAELEYYLIHVDPNDKDFQGRINGIK